LSIFRQAVLGFLVCAAALGLVACGSSSDSSSSSTSSAAENESGSSTESTGGSSEDVSCRIGFSSGVTNSVEQSLQTRIAEERAAEIGCTLVVGTASGDPAKQFNEVQQWITAEQVDAIVLLPIGGNPETLIKQATDAGIPVIGYGGPLPGGSGVVEILQEPAGEQLAEAAVKWAKEEFPGAKAKDFSYGILTFDECGSPCTERTDPSIAAMKKEMGVEPASNQVAFTEEEGLKDAENMLSAHPELSMILGVNDPAILGAQKAVQGAGREEQMFLGAIDGTPEGLEAIIAGGSFKVTAAIPLQEVADQIINVPATLLRTGKAPKVAIKSVLVDTPQKAEELLKTYEGG
jgi:ABC-type sugar transport system substrate-binding protein